MAALMIIPASVLGFIAALVRYLAFETTFSQAGLTYLAVTLAAPAALLWLMKIVQGLRNTRLIQVSDLQIS